MATIRVGTFNLNNLFSRFNFSAELPSDQTAVEATTTFTFSDPQDVKIRTYQGRLVKGKATSERAKLAKRIAAMNADVLAVQEVEDVDTLTAFNHTDLADLGYTFTVLVEGNDPRLIDVGVLSRYPIGAVTSWRHAVHPADPAQPVFSRDLLEVEILNPTRRKRLLTVFNTHLKSHYVPFTEDPQAGAEAANKRRARQGEAIATITSARMRPDSAFVVAGDMNDPPASEALAPMLTGIPLTNALSQAIADRPAPKDTPPAPDAPWTHRFKPTGQPAQYELFDQLWLSPSLAKQLLSAGIGRRTRLTGDGSDHDPAWVDLRISL